MRLLFPLALAKLPESPKWLIARGRVAEAEAVCARHRLPMPAPEAVHAVEAVHEGFIPGHGRRSHVGQRLPRPPADGVRDGSHRFAVTLAEHEANIAQMNAECP